ncbi:hypothetical protein KM043_007049 [Ampulex compressa]|nr:hypothetical protein KM043_007049 [Ampulex compressa]
MLNTEHGGRGETGWGEGGRREKRNEEGDWGMGGKRGVAHPRRLHPRWDKGHATKDGRVKRPVKKKEDECSEWTAGRTAPYSCRCEDSYFAEINLRDIMVHDIAQKS